MYDHQTRGKGGSSLSSECSMISAADMWQILERLKNSQTRVSTKHNYHKIWKHFNKFLIKLDSKPPRWEARVTLFCTYLVDKGTQSSTIRSYISAIKHMLKMDGYHWSDNDLLLSSLTRACKVINDTYHQRRPITKTILEIMLFELERLFSKDLYLEVIYKAVFIVAYYGLFRIGELAADTGAYSSNHAVKACNVHLGKNKDKILFVLYTSKTHGKESLPQKVKISANRSKQCGSSQKAKKPGQSHFCPFKVFCDYMVLRGGYESAEEQLFIFRNKVPLNPSQVRLVLKTCLDRVGLNANLFDCHSFRAGRTTDLVKLGYSIEQVQRLGRWKSNAVFRYIKC